MDMTNKIVYFPTVLPGSSAERIRGYNGVRDKLLFVRSTNRAELLIVIWLSGWAILTAAECIRQMSFLAI
jgi:hypothetical protein